MDLVNKLLFGALLVSFIVFILIVFKRQAPAAAGRSKSPMAIKLGVIFQSLSFSFAWTFRRPRVDPFGGESLWPDILIALFSLSLAIGAIALAAAAKKSLGRHWALAARVVDGHRLVVEGPFGRVRHPLYLAMGILLLAPVLGLSSWLGAALAIPLFIAGTCPRVRAEESLLAESFGREYEEYRRRVPAFIPRLGLGRSPVRQEDKSD